MKKTKKKKSENFIYFKGFFVGALTVVITLSLGFTVKAQGEGILETILKEVLEVKNIVLQQNKEKESELEVQDDSQVSVQSSYARYTCEAKDEEGDGKDFYSKGVIVISRIRNSDNKVLFKREYPDRASSRSVRDYYCLKSVGSNLGDVRGLQRRSCTIENGACKADETAAGSQTQTSTSKYTYKCEVKDEEGDGRDFYSNGTLVISRIRNSDNKVLFKREYPDRATSKSVIDYYCLSSEGPSLGSVKGMQSRSCTIENGACKDNCSEEGAKVYNDPSLGSTECCEPDAEIKPFVSLVNDSCTNTENGVVGTCMKKWGDICGNGTCNKNHEDECNCPQDCLKPEIVLESAPAAINGQIEANVGENIDFYVEDKNNSEEVIGSLRYEWKYNKYILECSNNSSSLLECIPKKETKKPINIRAIAYDKNNTAYRSNIIKIIVNKNVQVQPDKPDLYVGEVSYNNDIDSITAEICNNGTEIKSPFEDPSNITNLSIKYIVIKDGNEISFEDHWAYFYIGAGPDTCKEHPSQAATKNFGIELKGSYKVKVYVDSRNVVDESNHENNNETDWQEVYVQ